MPSYLDYHAINAARSHVDGLAPDKEQLKKLEQLCSELISVLRTCGPYMFLLQIEGARNADAQVARSLKEPWLRTLQGCDLIGNPPQEMPTLNWFRDQLAPNADLMKMLLIKEVTVTFLAYVKSEARAKRNGV